jgi:hypothetical protein
VSEQEPDPGDGGAESFAGAGIEHDPTVFAAIPQEHSEIPTSVGNKPARRAGWAAALGVGYVVLAAGTAFGVIADKSPAAVDVTAVNASAYAATASPTASVSAAAGAHASKSASAGTAPSPSAAATTTAAATPKSTVTGSVSAGIHHGDLRYFLLTPPQGASSVQGDPDGTTQTIDDVISTYTDQSQVKSSLQQMGFKTACERTYQDTTMSANVDIELLQFDGSGGASQWLSDFGFSGNGYQSISVSGESAAVGWSYAKAGYYELVGAYREGDTFFQVTIYGQSVIPAQDLGRVISAEHARLAHG